MEIRSARTDEIDAIRELLAQCGLPVEDVSGSAPIQFLVAAVDSDSTIVGCVGLEAYGAVGLLRSLAVAADARQGMNGFALVAEAESVARRGGIEELHLLTTTASGFFLRNGYEVVGREVVPLAIKQTTQFSALCPATAVCMKKRIGNINALRP
ncbi:arsenic resistance N-acetyltransferase ArsN2 [Paraburkholderia flagellata]|uniref:arsenic resistance N-acetyltransferase ArsN2 n=1 Tax=Paraburkholderia flagellata TaxID=2883241 RepID=UPI001F2527FB|nr:arsenic resistance N-acetyltransferase ArsN2 [Paraburkholderia flagellata]